MEVINAAVQAYAEKFSDAPDEVLLAIEAETLASHPQAHMLSGRLQGKFLQFISTILQPTYILEIGTFTGYSAICLAKGLKGGGMVHTIEVREAEALVARANFNRSGDRDRIILHLGNALAIIPTLPFTWDLVFIDADKVNYTAYYELVLPRLRKGGVILADNVLFHGQVLEEPIAGKNAKAIHAFNETVSRDERVDKVMVTLRDGLMLIRKK